MPACSHTDARTSRSRFSPFHLLDHLRVGLAMRARRRASVCAAPVASFLMARVDEMGGEVRLLLRGVDLFSSWILSLSPGLGSLACLYYERRPDLKRKPTIRGCELVCVREPVALTLQHTATLASTLGRNKIIASRRPSGMHAPRSSSSACHDVWKNRRPGCDREIAADASPISIRPVLAGHPSGRGRARWHPSFTGRAAGVIWALDYLLGRCDPRCANFRPVLPSFWTDVAAFESQFANRIRQAWIAAPWRHGCGPSRDAPCATSGPGRSGVHGAEANNELPIRELMWGMPGSMVAAIHMAG